MPLYIVGTNGILRKADAGFRTVFSNNLDHMIHFCVGNRVVYNQNLSAEIDRTLLDA